MNKMLSGERKVCLCEVNEFLWAVGNGEIAGWYTDVPGSLLCSAHLWITCPTGYRNQSIIMSFWIYTEKLDNMCRTLFLFWYQ